MAEKRFINPPGLLRPGAYTPTVVATGGRTVYIAGQVAQNEKGEVVGKGDGPTTAGPARVPLSSVVGDYADRATASAQRAQIVEAADVFKRRWISHVDGEMRCACGVTSRPIPSPGSTAILYVAMIRSSGPARSCPSAPAPRAAREGSRRGPP